MVRSSFMGACARLAIMLGVASAAGLSSSNARAESGVFNLHLDLGAGVPILGEFGPAAPGSPFLVGPVGTLGFDWQIAPPFALELIGGGGYLISTSASLSGRPYVHAALGPRFRFVDNREGYANEPRGDLAGNFWLSGHLGYHLMDGSQFGIDLGGGYEWSVLRPLQIGVFLRAALLFDFAPMRQVDALATLGVSFSIEIGRARVVDTDGDGLSDEREQQAHNTNPTNPDTDGDGLNDGLEVRTNTNPTNPDTDGDGLTDGAEDTNRNGSADGRESDPRVADTDHGGVNDAWEAQHPPHNPRFAGDDDSDGDRVLDDHDACPGTPMGTEVDARGCAILRAELVLDGINFETGSAAILPTSETTLQRAAQILRDNPGVRVEIGGHTDNVGNARDNLQLSQSRADSVRQWLVQQGIPADRMTVRGYGLTHPRADNATEEGRAQNRRIEFHRLDRH